MQLIGYSYFDPEVLSVKDSCKSESGRDTAATLDLVEAFLNGTSCTASSSSTVAAAQKLRDDFAAFCNDEDLCTSQLESCLSEVLDLDISANEFLDVLCSYTDAIKTCVGSSSTCSQAFLAQLTAYCSPQLCRAGIQSCYDKYQSNTSLLSGTAQEYLSSWCGASTSIETCLGDKKDFCDQSSFSFSSFAAELNAVCDKATTVSSGDSCYWTALGCFWDNLIDENTPAVFWTTTTDSLCSSENLETAKACLVDAVSQCGDDGAAVASLQNSLDTNCVDVCSATKKEECDRSLTAYVEAVFSGNAAAYCGIFAEQKSCYGYIMKRCSKQVQSIVQANLAILESIFVGFDLTCYEYSTTPAPTNVPDCMKDVAACFVNYVSSFDINVDVLTNSTVCTWSSELEDCLAGELAVCTDGTVAAVAGRLKQAVSGVIDDLSTCNPQSECRLKESVECVTRLTAQVTAAAMYSAPVSYDGSSRKGFCRKLDSSSSLTCGCRSRDRTRVPKKCKTYDFFWGSICLSVNSTLECVHTATEKCGDAIQEQQVQTVQLSAAAYIKKCKNFEVVCEVERSVEIINEIISFGLQVILYPNTSPQPVLCAQLTELLNELWRVSVQCSPYIDRYLWKFIEAYYELTTSACIPPEIIYPPLPKPLPPWNRNITTSCSVVEILVKLQLFFEKVVKLSVTAVPDKTAIVGAWTEFKESLEVIYRSDVNYDEALCVWVVTAVT
jgi:hypothetical protein